MATAANLNFHKGPLIDLSFLTPEEKAKLEAVIRADQNLLIRDRVRVGTLRQELEKERYFQQQLKDKPKCTVCEHELGRLFNTGAPCPSCQYRICKHCRIISHNPPPPFLCPICTKKRLLDIQAADYMSSPSSQFSPSPLFGSQLVMMSLEASHISERGGMINPYDGKAKKTLMTTLSQAQLLSAGGTKLRSGTNGSVDARDAEFQRSESVLSGKSEDGSIGRRERPSSLPAQRVPISELSDSEDEENDRNVLGVPNVTKMRHSDSISSMGSLSSMYSAAGGKGDYTISGEVHFGVWYSRDGLLKVHVDQARNLAAARKEGYSYPYVKVYLLPDRSKQTKRKTGFVRRTVCPKYDETFKYKVSEGELLSRTVWLSVWDWDRFGRNHFLGELKLPLTSLDLTDDTDHWHTLLDQDESAQLEVEKQYKGRLLLGLMFQLDEDGNVSPPPSSHGRHQRAWKKKGVLHVAVRRAEDLPKMDSIGLTDAVAKCYLLPSRTSSNKRKTQVVMNSVAPVWNEEFTYKCSQGELEGERVLEITVWDYDKRGSNDFIGGLHIGPRPSGSSHNKEWMDSIGEEASHWETVLAQPGEWIEKWHTLRPRMDCTITKLPEKPTTPSHCRELSPVHETLSPTPEEEEGRIGGRGEEGERNDLLPGEQPRKESLSSVARHTQESAAESVTARSSSFPAKDSTVAKQKRNNGHKMSPLMYSKKKHEDSPGARSDTTPVQSHSPSPVPELLVTPIPTGMTVQHASSTSSIHSTFSEVETERGDYDIVGEVHVGFTYRGGKLLIHVNRARGLAAADSNGYSDPYVKTYLLPDRTKHSKRKTTVQKKTLHPIFNETLEYKVSEGELSSRTVWLSVWDWDRFGRNHFLGELKLPLTSLDLRNETGMWYMLLDKGQPYNPHNGQIQLALKFTPRETEGGVTYGTLSVEIKRASNLSAGDNKTGHPSPYVKCNLLPDQSEDAQRKTAIVKTSSKPSWKEKFLFERLTLEEIARERVLELTVCDSNRDGDSYTIGGLHIGPTPSGSSQNKEWMDSTPDEASHWEAMLARPGEWCEQWHTLRRSIEPRGIDISAIRTSSIDDEFRKITSKSSTGSPRESPVRHPFNQRSSDSADEKLSSSQHSLNQVTSKNPVENRFAASSSSGLTRSTSPLTTAHSYSSNVTSEPTLGEISRSKDPLHSRSGSPESPDITPRSTLEQSSNQKPPPGPLKHSGLLGVKHAGSHSSFGSQLSVYSSAGGGKGNYDITGEILLGIRYGGGKLLIHVNRARGLAAADSNGYSDPYVKTYLLPDRTKHSKRKTTVQRKTLDPVYDQTLVYKVSEGELSSRTVWLSVWDWDRFGRNQFLGELKLPLTSLDLTDNTNRWHTLLDKDEDSEAADFYRGQLNLALRFTPSDTRRGKTRGSFQAIIKQGRDFPSMGGNDKPDPVVKCYLLPDKSSAGKRKVGIIKNQNNPVWEELLSFEKVILEEMATERVLEVTVWDWDKKGSSFIGGLRIGPTPSGTFHYKEWMDSIGEEVSHWEMMLASPGEWIEKWHTLRTTMDHRNIAFQ